jgi:5'-methylthioadenosine phosphorylase
MRPMDRVAIIGGTGTESLEWPHRPQTLTVATPYGSVDVQETDGVTFLSRHGSTYVAPHQINARANVRALLQLGVTHVFATSACGSLRETLSPGHFAVITDFVDFTRGRVCTFEPAGPPVYTDMSAPYDATLRRALVEAASGLGEAIETEAVYACTEGPRFETRAEIRAYRTLGCDLVGMTQVPEVVLAREAGLPYAALAIVTNFAAGMQSAVTEEEVRGMMAIRGRVATRILLRACSLVLSG